MTAYAKHARRPVRQRAGSLKRLTRSAVATAAVFALFGGAAAAAAQELGIDVSGHQHPNGTSINWSKVRADGVTFAFIKATEGKTYENPYFASDWSSSGSVGIYHGAYHFARPSLGSAATQASHFVSTAGLADQPGDLPPALDLEDTGGLGVKALRTWTANWLEKVEDLTGRKPIIYTSPSFWENRMGNSTAFTAYPLWIANYKVSAPHVPGGWPTWTFWQGASDGSVSGISGSVDMDAFNGTPAELAALANASVPAPAPVEASEPSTTKVGTAVTLATSRRSVYRGQSVTLSGDLTTDGGAPLANKRAVVKARPEGQTTWSNVAAVTTDAAGHFATTSKVTAATSYKVVFAGTTRYARSVSSLQSVAITPKTVTSLQLSADRTSVLKGRRVKLVGHLTTAGGAALSGRRVRYYVRPTGATAWTLVGSSSTTTPTGWHQLYVKPSKTSTYKAVYRGGLRYTRATSTWVKVRVR